MYDLKDMVIIKQNVLSEEDFEKCLDIIKAYRFQPQERGLANYKRWHPETGTFIPNTLVEVLNQEDIKNEANGKPDLSWKWFIGNYASQLEVQVTVYEEGDFYRWHIDHSGITADEHLRRILNFILYVKVPEEGGELQLSSDFDQMEGCDYDCDHTIGMSIKPKKNMLVIVPSWIPHKVTSIIKGNRVTINGHIAL